MFYKVINNNYSFIKVKPSTNIKNGKNVENLVKLLHSIYLTSKDRFKIQNKQLNFKNQYMFSYELYMSKDDISFNYRVPEDFKNSIVQKIKSVWSNSSVSNTNDTLEHFNLSKSIYKDLEFDNLSFQSLRVDYKLTFPLRQILDIKDCLENGDQLLIQYMFKPINDEWKDKAITQYTNYKNGNVAAAKGSIADKIFKVLDSVMNDADTIMDYAANDNHKDIDYSSNKDYYNSRKFSNNTINKMKTMGFKGCVRVIVNAKNSSKNESILNSIYVALKTLDEDNNLVFKKTNNIITDKNKSIILNRNFDSDDIFGIGEVAQIMQLPNKELQKIYSVKALDERLVNIKKELTTGSIQTGRIEPGKGSKDIPLTIPDEFNSASKPTLVVGPAGGGKSTLSENMLIQICNNTNHGLVVFDYIKNCELTDHVLSNIKNQDKVLIYDLSDLDLLPLLDFSELKVDINTSVNERYVKSYMLKDVIIELIESVQTGSTEAMSSKMLKVLSAACLVTCIQPEASINLVRRVIEDVDTRHEYIDRALKDMPKFFDEKEENITTLRNLDDINNKTKKVGTVSSVSFIIDRMNRLTSFLHINLMYKSDKGINFVDLLNKGYRIFFKMPDSEISKPEKNIIVTAFFIKIWLANKIRGGQCEKPLISHIYIDEINQCPTVAKIMSSFVTEVRKFGCNYIFTAHSMEQFGLLKKSLEETGVNYIIIAGTEKTILKDLVIEYKPFTYEEAMNLPKWHALNIFRLDNERYVYVSHLNELNKFL